MIAGNFKCNKQKTFAMLLRGLRNRSTKRAWLSAHLRNKYDISAMYERSNFMPGITYTLVGIILSPTSQSGPRSGKLCRTAHSIWHDAEKFHKEHRPIS